MGLQEIIREMENAISFAKERETDNDYYHPMNAACDRMEYNTLEKYLPRLKSLLTEPSETDWLSKKQNIVVWDAINGDFYEFEDLKSALKDIKENFSDPEEGIHPDIESIRVFNEIADVVLQPIAGKENTFKITLRPQPPQT